MTGHAGRICCAEGGADMTCLTSHVDMGTVEHKPGTEVVERFLRVSGRL